MMLLLVLALLLFTVLQVRGVRFPMPIGRNMRELSQSTQKNGYIVIGSSVIVHPSQDLYKKCFRQLLCGDLIEFIVPKL